MDDSVNELIYFPVWPLRGEGEGREKKLTTDDAVDATGKGIRHYEQHTIKAITKS